MVHITPFGIRLVLDGAGAILFLLLMATLGAMSVGMLGRRRRFVVRTGMLLAALSIAVLHRGMVAPAQSWPLILAAYESSSGIARLQRAADLRANWHRGEIRMVDWWLLSHRWHVCHGMWPQGECTRPAGPYEAQDSARESLEDIATSRRDPVISI